MQINVSKHIYSSHAPLISGKVPDHFRVVRQEGILTTSFWHIARMAAIRDAEQDHYSIVTAHLSEEVEACH